MNVIYIDLTYQALSITKHQRFSSLNLSYYLKENKKGTDLEIEEKSQEILNCLMSETIGDQLLSFIVKIAGYFVIIYQDRKLIILNTHLDADNPVETKWNIYSHHSAKWNTMG